MTPDRGKILVIDDDETIRRNCRKILEPEGHTVETCAEVPEGLKTLQGDFFDLVLTDPRMPDMDGSEMIKKSKNTGLIIDQFRE
ncbi:MAG TPA: hypothetical protein DCP92_17460 [Nitrospiraceae bacterium]|nr:hypothetical protein [Nitrospiraceae bacterium]